MFTVDATGKGWSTKVSAWLFWFVISYPHERSLHVDDLALELERRRPRYPNGIGRLFSYSLDVSAPVARMTVHVWSGYGKDDVDRAVDSFLNCQSHLGRMDNSLDSAIPIYYALAIESMSASSIERYRGELIDEIRRLGRLIEDPSELDQNADRRRRDLLLEKLARLEDAAGAPVFPHRNRAKPRADGASVSERTG